MLYKQLPSEMKMEVFWFSNLSFVGLQHYSEVNNKWLSPQQLMHVHFI